MADELFELRNYFYLGNLTTAVTEGETVSVDDDVARLERDIILARIELAKGNYDRLLTSIADDAAPGMQVVKLLARLSKDASSKDEISDILVALTADDLSNHSPSFLALAAIAHARLGDFDNALRCAHRGSGLEERAIMVQVLLQMDRIDVAEKEVSTMQNVDEDATLTQLATAWTHLARGGENAQEALYIYQDLLERHGATDAILNGMAVCHLAMGKPEESERVLSEALTKNPNCPASLVNAICTSKYKNKPAELVSRYFAQLERVDASNEWLVHYRKKEAEFDQLAEQIHAA